MVELIGGAIRERRARGVDGDDFLATLVSARHADGTPLDDDLVTGLLLAIVFGGQHTSAVMAAWTGVLLLEHPELLPPVLAEQRRVLGDGPLSLEALRQLVLFERCIKEAERMHPPLILLVRKVMQDLEYGGFVARAGELAMVSPAASHRIADVFAEPDRYDPERFAPGRLEDKKHKFALIGFGGGHHRCIGSTFAYQQIKVIWSVLFRHFDLEIVGRGHVPDYSTFVPGPRPPCRLRYRRRSAAR
jgi:sterol 14-demethylase